MQSVVGFYQDGSVIRIECKSSVGRARNVIYEDVKKSET